MKRSILLSFLLLAFIMAFNSCGSKKDAVLQETRSPEEILQDGDLLFAQGDYKSALDTYQRLLIFYPTSELDIDAKLRMAECYNKLEEYEKQMDLLLQMLKENLIPEKVPAIYVQIGKYYEEAARFNPQNADTMDYKTAIEYYQRAIKYEDSNDEWSKAEAKYRIGLVYAKIGKLDQAREAYERVIVENAETPFAVLAQIKLQNPDNLMELSTVPDSIEAYKERLGSLLQQAEEKPLPEEQKTPTLEEYIQSPETPATPADTSGTSEEN
ncbi:tetratricopeptide repeat protein [Caldithrix abyssi]